MAWFGGSQARGQVDLVVGGRDSPDPVPTLNNLTYTITVTNSGATPATGVSITNILSSSVSFVSVTTTRGACSNVSGVVYCDWGAVDAAAGGRVTIVAQPITPGPITNVVSAGANETDAAPANNSLTLTTTAVNRRTFANQDFIQIDEVLANPATPYPSTLSVSGLTAAVHKVTVTLNNVRHTSLEDTGPDDLDVMLVAPNGAYVMLMSDGPVSPGMVDVIITFDDAAAQYIPDTNAITTGSYKPANYGSLPDFMPAPAPEGPHVPSFTSLAIFNGANPNGDWRLYVYDDEPEAGGWIDGWSLTISTLEPIADVGVQLTDSPDPAFPGEIITYTATVTNMGPAGATGVRLTNQVAAGFEVVSYSVTRGSCANGSGTISCDIGALDVGASEQVVIQTRAANGGTYTNRAQVISQQLDLQTGNNTAIHGTTVDPRVDLGVEMASSRTPALLEQPLIYTLALTNQGPDSATGVRVVNELPAGVLLVNATPSQGSCSTGSGVVTCNLGTVASRGRATVLLTCRPTVLGPITNLAAVTADQADSNLANNSAQNANTVDPAADLQLSLSDSPDPVPLGAPLSYSIFLTNRGPSMATNIVIADVLPASLAFVSAQTSHGGCTNDGNSVACLIGELPPGERVLVTITARPVSVGTVVNTASAAAQPVDPLTANNAASVSTLVSAAADLSVTKTGDRALVWEGDRLNYSFVVSNHGPSTASKARLSDALPAGMSFVSASASAGSCALQGGLVICTFGDLAPGNAVTVSIIGAVGGAGMITNVANVLASEQDLNPANNSAVAAATVIPRTVSVGDTNPVVIPEAGPVLPYPLTINISGMTAAVQRVRVTLAGFSHSYPDDVDVLLVGPGGQAVAVMSDAGGSTAASNLDLTLDDLAAGALPDSSALGASLYRPADYEAAVGEFPSPAPAGPHASSFDVFTGTDPNGAWQLYLLDDAVKDEGVLAGGWRLDIWARDPLADLAVTAQAPPEVVAVGSNVTISVTVSNYGPGSALAVVLTNAPGPELAFNGAAASQGSCTNEAGLVRCELGEMAPGSSAVVQMSFVAILSGTVSNVPGVTASSVDLNPANNASAISFVAENAPMIASQPQHRFVSAGATATFEVVANGDPPLSYQWYFNESPIPEATNTSFTVNDVQLESLGNYRMQVSNRVGAVLSDVARLDFALAPGMEPTADQLIGEDELLTLPLVISDPNDPFQIFQLSAVCDDTNLVPSTNMTFTASGTNYALVIRPGTNQFGTNIVTVTATDSEGLMASRTFVLGVQSVNDYPYFIVPVGDQVMLEDGVIHLPFVIGDVETRAAQLVTAARSYNPALQIGIAVSGADSNRVLTVAPAADQFGSTLVEIRVRDEAVVRSTNLFTLTILPVEDAPTISSVDDVTISEDGELMVGFVVGDVETALADLLLRVESSNPALFANDSFLFEGSGSFRLLSARPAANQIGDSRITVFVEDEAGVVSSSGFWVTVDPVNDAPFVSDIPDVVTIMDQTSVAVAFTVGDLESDADSLTLTGVSTNTVLAPLEGIVFSGSGSNRLVQVTPGAGQFGWTALRVEVSDPDGGVMTREFSFTVHQTSGPPVIILQPQSQVVTRGSPVTLRVVATGPGTLTYQWRRDGQALPDQTNAVVAISSSAGADRGEYQVIVANGEGSVTSLPAQLRVFEGTRILSLRRLGGTVELTFGTVAGQRYFVEFQDSLGLGWTALPEVPGTGEVVTAIDPDAAGNSRFYRVRVE